jgi:hypothetical protein
MMNYEKMAEVIAAKNEAARREFETASSISFPATPVENTAQPSPQFWQPPLFPPSSQE